MSKPISIISALKRRDTSVSVFISAGDRDRIDAIAQQARVTRSEVIRHFIELGLSQVAEEESETQSRPETTLTGPTNEGDVT